MDGQKGTGKELKSVAVSDLEPGDAFSEAVYIDKDNLLVPINASVLQKDIDKLVSRGIDTVYTAGRHLGDKRPGDDPPDGKEPYRPVETFPIGIPEIGAEHSFTAMQKNRSAYKSYRGFIERMNWLFLKLSEGSVINVKSVNAVATQLLQALRKQREQYVGFVLGGEVKGYEMAKSAVNIAILSGLTAQEIRLPSHRVLYVIIGALLHDAGMFQMPREILEKKGDLTTEERKRIRGHTLRSREIVMRELSYPEEIGDIVLQHHER